MLGLYNCLFRSLNLSLVTGPSQFKNIALKAHYFEVFPAYYQVRLRLVWVRSTPQDQGQGPAELGSQEWYIDQAFYTFNLHMSNNIFNTKKSNICLFVCLYVNINTFVPTRDAKPLRLSLFLLLKVLEYLNVDVTPSANMHPPTPKTKTIQRNLKKKIFTGAVSIATKG